MPDSNLLTNGLDIERPRILIIDDEPEIAEEIESYLSYQGYSCETASDGLDGLKALEENGDVRIVITDVRMPRLDGVGLLTKLAQSDASDRLQLVVVISGFRDSSIVDEVRQALPLKFIAKPIALKELLSLVREAGPQLVEQ